VLVGQGLDCHAVRADLEKLLAGTYQIRHTTLQVDHAPDQVLSIRPGAAAEAGDEPRADRAPGAGHCTQAHGPAHQAAVPAGDRPPAAPANRRARAGG
jgi:cobalt-zinc-cadmium efflux system protein